MSKRRRHIRRRKFDYDDIRRRHATGESIHSIARSIGAARQTVQYALRKAADAAVVPASYSSDCPACGGWKEHGSILCRGCRRSGGRSLEEEWDLLVPTTLSDVDPPLDYLSYHPREGPFHLLAVWGYSAVARREGMARCDFLIVDAETGRVQEEIRNKSRRRAELLAPELRRRIRALNARERVSA